MGERSDVETESVVSDIADRGSGATSGGAASCLGKHELGVFPVHGTGGGTWLRPLLWEVFVPIPLLHTGGQHIPDKAATDLPNLTLVL